MSFTSCDNPPIIGLFMPPDLAVRARREEEARAEFGAAWNSYSDRVPAFIPRF